MPLGGFASSGCLRHECDIPSMTIASIISTCWGIPFPHADLSPIFVIWKAFGGRTGLWSRDGLEHRGQSQHRGGAALPRRGGLGAAHAQRGGRRSAAAEAETTAASVARASAVEGERTKKLVKAKHLGFPKVNFGWKLREVFKPMFFVWKKSQSIRPPLLPQMITI